LLVEEVSDEDGVPEVKIEQMEYQEFIDKNYINHIKNEMSKKDSLSSIEKFSEKHVASSSSLEYSGTY
jgi:hypothetical protein